MQQGTLDDAIVLAKSRWTALHPFDLSEENWEQLFQDHNALDVLTAISKTRHTHDSRPEKIYLSLLFWLGRLEAERLAANPTWQDIATTCKQI